MTDAQTEARAIAQTSLWVPAKPEHAKIGWTYDFEQTERISRAAYDSTGYDATMEVVEFVMAEADRRLATALAAKDAELAAVKRQIVAAWNAFGPSSSRNDPPAFDADDLEHLPITAGGGLDEQIRELEDQTERAKAALAEARKALEPFATAADNFDGFKIANDEEWFAYGGIQSATGSKGAIAVADLRAARRALGRKA